MYYIRILAHTYAHTHIYISMAIQKTISQFPYHQIVFLMILYLLSKRNFYIILLYYRCNEIIILVTIVKEK